MKISGPAFQSPQKKTPHRNIFFNLCLFHTLPIPGGSDVHYFNHARIGDFVLGEPMCLGHESAGVIVKTGSKVDNVKVGDNVAMEPGEVCKRCDYCKSGKYEVS